jgi:hypothetical protein
MRVSTLLPAQERRQVIDEDAAWPDASPYPAKGEQKWQVRVMPTVDQQWDTFLNVVQAYDSGTLLRNTLVRSTGGEAEGALIEREGHPDTLVLFSAEPEDRALRSGYRITWSSDALTTELLLLDLDPRMYWTLYSGAPLPVRLRVTAQGVGRHILYGAGTHSIRLQSTGGFLIR